MSDQPPHAPQGPDASQGPDAASDVVDDASPTTPPVSMPGEGEVDAADAPGIVAGESDEPDVEAVPGVPDLEAVPTGRRPDRLEEEGEVAADYLEELLDIVDLDGDIDIDVEDDRAIVSVVGDPDAPATSTALRVLAGRHGDVLEALQELTRLAVQTRTGERSRLMLDVAGYREERRAQLEELATEAVREARAGGTPVRLSPMNPFERKVVHDAVAAAGLSSDSEGVEPQRRVVVHAE